MSEHYSAEKIDVKIAVLEFRVKSMEDSVKADINGLRHDLQEEAKYTREAFSKRDAAQNVTMVGVILGLVGITAQILIHFLPVSAR